MTQHRLSFSLVVATVHRTDELDVLFSSLVGQTRPPYEVILVDQNGDDRLVEIVGKYKEKLPVKRITATSEGLSRARNIGKKIATGDVVTFPDDDCEYTSTLLEEVEKVLLNNPQFDAVSIRSEARQGGAITRFSLKPKYVHKFNIYRTVIEFGIFFRKECIAGYDYNEELGVGAPTPYWSDEGADLLVRLLAAGKSIFYWPEIVVYHENPVKLYDQRSWQRSARYGCGRGRFLRLHSYPWWFVAYTWSTYLAGASVSFLQGRFGKSRYYWEGFKSRVHCYFDKV